MQFIDLKTQYNRINSQLNSAINTVLRHGQYIMGPEIDKLENKLAQFTGTEYCISCSSGTDALLMSLMAAEISNGDAVFTTPFSFIATAEVVQILGAIPVFVDIQEDTFNIDPNLLTEAVDECQNNGKLYPKAVIPVNIFGLPADYGEIEKMGKENNLFVKDS